MESVLKWVVAYHESNPIKPIWITIVEGMEMDRNYQFQKDHYHEKITLSGGTKYMTDKLHGYIDTYDPIYWNR